jgi:hypothetical protein
MVRAERKIVPMHFQLKSGEYRDVERAPGLYCSTQRVATAKDGWMC